MSDVPQQKVHLLIKIHVYSNWSTPIVDHMLISCVRLVFFLCVTL